MLKPKRKEWVLLGAGAVLSALFLAMAGCTPGAARGPGAAITTGDMERVAVVGFRSALSPGEPSGVVRDPLTGSIFHAEPVPERVVRRMTRALMDRLTQRGGFVWLPPGQVRGVISAVVGEDRGLSLNSRQMLQAVGRALRADGILVGHVYRWKDRAGTDYAVNRPASVAFDLLLVRTRDGRVLWRDKYDKTQRSLSENILDFSTFFRGGGKWMTAEELVLMGLGRVLSRMPGPDPDKGREE
ncbi:MAG: hypothetical protein JRJ35_03335 [Deltaproteobacteria bacterium]|nr:hypothetical protein [Deltaproteobacteria bacterium]MBW1922484.1 hypothetical protein [Deltaproteobacteria bacterium]MBW1948331.1 hypothetical protein [Deltaproteobacteria bacterium]MBW2006615.1 hypothetical protein [Deltaproteobacteria bacterium]MBW2101500.1 hypothetical protein [Deltaproteobacteria bacterium]